MKNKFLLLSVSGPDHPGITHGLMKIIEHNGQSLRDMGQSVTHNLLSLSIYLEMTHPEGESELLKELLFLANKKNLTLSYEFKEENEIYPWFDYEKFVLNCISTHSLTPSFMKDIAQILSEHNINIHRIDNLHPTDFRCLELVTTLPPELDLNKVKIDLLKI